MSSDAAKDFLEKRLKIPAREWKRLSKKSDGSGGSVREFESLAGGRVGVSESAQGKLSIAPQNSAAAKTNATAAGADLDHASATLIQGTFAQGCAEPSRARIWGEINGDPWGDPSDSGTLFDGMNCDELADFELFIGPSPAIEVFLTQAAKKIDSSWRGLASSDASDYDCIALTVWEDGGPWAAAGFFRMQQVYTGSEAAPGNMGWDLRQLAKTRHPKILPLFDSHGQYGSIEDLTQQLSELDGAPPEAVRAAALFMGESELVRRLTHGPDPGDSSFCPALGQAIGEIFALREARALSDTAHTGTRALSNPRRQSI